MPSNCKLPIFLSILNHLSFLLHCSSATHFLLFPFFLPGGMHSGICLGHLFSAIHSGYKNIMFQIIQKRNFVHIFFSKWKFGILSFLDVPANYLQKVYFHCQKIFYFLLKMPQLWTWRYNITYRCLLNTFFSFLCTPSPHFTVNMKCYKVIKRHKMRLSVS